MVSTVREYTKTAEGKCCKCACKGLTYASCNDTTKKASMCYWRFGHGQSVSAVQSNDRSGALVGVDLTARVAEGHS
jgi:hypothetical protein